MRLLPRCRLSHVLVFELSGIEKGENPTICDMKVRFGAPFCCFRLVLM